MLIIKKRLISWLYWTVAAFNFLLLVTFNRKEVGINDRH